MYDRPDEAVTPQATRLLRLIQHPVRLPLLLELERLGESTATDLRHRLGESFDTVNYALRQLAAEGAVAFVRQEPRRGSNVNRNFYRVRATGWAQVTEVIEKYADRLNPPLDGEQHTTSA